MIYTEVETHPANLRERWQVLSLLWRATADPEVPARSRWTVRRMAVRRYVLSLRPFVSTYLVNRNA